MSSSSFFRGISSPPAPQGFQSNLGNLSELVSEHAKFRQDFIDKYYLKFQQKFRELDDPLSSLAKAFTAAAKDIGQYKDHCPEPERFFLEFEALIPKLEEKLYSLADEATKLLSKVLEVDNNLNSALVKIIDQLHFFQMTTVSLPQDKARSSYLLFAAAYQEERNRVRTSSTTKNLAKNVLEDCMTALKGAHDQFKELKLLLENFDLDIEMAVLQNKQNALLRATKEFQMMFEPALKQETILRPEQQQNEEKSVFGAANEDVAQDEMLLGDEAHQNRLG